MPEYILLINSEDSLLVEKGKVNQTKYGKIDARNIKEGDIVIASKSRFIAIKPNVIDLLNRCKRGSQVVLPKDASQILSITGLSYGWRCLDSGAGSGFLAIFLGNIVGKKGRVYTYEKRKEFYEIAKKNIEICGLEKIVKIKNEDVKNFRERNLDLITLDMKNSHEIVTKAKKALKSGGWLVVYSPHVEGQIACLDEMRKNGFHIYATIENIQRKWKSIGGYTHPEPSGILHTGFMTFGRKTMD
ncbi:MAG: methyltransferase domain-containing protein [Thermoplasmatales archaeon]|nr:methyltransferase domain-containing protein [Thermoplasmatales archaeon]